MTAGPVVVLILSHRDPPLVHRLVSRLTAGSNTAVVIHHDPTGPALDLPRSDAVLTMPSPLHAEWGRMSLALDRDQRAALRRHPRPRAVVGARRSPGQDYPTRSMNDIEADLAQLVERRLSTVFPGRSPARQRRASLAAAHPSPVSAQDPAPRHAPVGAVPAAASVRRQGAVAVRRATSGSISTGGGSPRSRAAAPAATGRALLQLVFDSGRRISVHAAAEQCATFGIEDDRRRYISVGQRPAPSGVAGHQLMWKRPRRAPILFARKVDSERTPDVLDMFDRLAGA